VKNKLKKHNMAKAAHNNMAQALNNNNMANAAQNNNNMAQAGLRLLNVNIWRAVGNH
jgi:hypothetical protein